MPAKSTRELLVEKSIDLFCRRSFHQIGIDQIVKHAGISKATFYNHFDSKDELLVAVLEHWTVELKAVFIERLNKHAGSDPLHKLRSVFTVLAQCFEEKQHRGGLFMSATCTFSSETDPAYQVAKASVDAIRGLLIELADDAGIRHPFEFAQQFQLVMQGAIASEAVYRRQRAARTAGQVADRVINSFLNKDDVRGSSAT